MRKIIIAGANSFVASHFIHELLLKDYQIIALVRGNAGGSAKERMLEAINDTTLQYPLDSGQLTVLNYALSDPNFSIANQTLKDIYTGKVDYFHFAASLKFDFHSKEEIFATNVAGLENALHIFHQYASDQARFFFISTAYSCGKLSGVFKEKYYPDEPIESFRNYYEQSKRYGENVIRRFTNLHGINSHIIRLSQVVGNSKNGVTRTDYGIFDFAKRIHSLSLAHPHQKVRIEVDPDATQNLIPIDTVVNDLISMMEKQQVPDIMNFVANQSIKNQNIIQSLSELLPIQLIPQKDISKDNMNAIEKMVLAGMTFTGNYIDTDINFDASKRDKVISSQHREVNDASVFAMLSYFLNHITIENLTE